MSPVGVYKQGDTASKVKSTHLEDEKICIANPHPTPWSGSHPVELPTDWMNQLYDREAAEVLGLFLETPPSLGAYRNGIYSPSTSPASLS